MEAYKKEFENVKLVALRLNTLYMSSDYTEGESNIVYKGIYNVKYSVVQPKRTLGGRNFKFGVWTLYL